MKFPAGRKKLSISAMPIDANNIAKISINRLRRRFVMPGNAQNYTDCCKESGTEIFFTYTQIVLAGMTHRLDNSGR